FQNKDLAMRVIGYGQPASILSKCKEARLIAPGDANPLRRPDKDAGGIAWPLMPDWPAKDAARARSDETTVSGVEASGPRDADPQPPHFFARSSVPKPNAVVASGSDETPVRAEAGNPRPLVRPVVTAKRTAFGAVGDCPNRTTHGHARAIGAKSAQVGLGHRD